MSLRKLTVRTRNLLGFCLLGGILLVTGGVALMQIQDLKSNVLEMRDEWMLGLDWMAQMKSDRQNIRLKESLVLTIPDQVDSLSQDINQFLLSVHEVEQKYDSEIVYENDRRAFDAYSPRPASMSRHCRPYWRRCVPVSRIWPVLGPASRPIPT